MDRYPFVPDDLPPDHPVLVEGGVGGEGGREWPVDALRLTIEFADGRSVTNVDRLTSAPMSRTRTARY
jgi:hypothetical protein